MRYVFTAIMLIGLLAGCGGDDEADDAGEFAKSQMEATLKQQWGKMYDGLHPEYQEIVSRERFMECNSDSAIPAFDVAVDETYPETLTLPRVGEVATEAVTLALTLGENTQYLTLNLVDVDGAWKWLLTEEHTAAYEQGECP